MAALIYLACPFRHTDPLVQKKRCAASHYAAAQLIKQGLFVFSPLTHNEILLEILNDTLPPEQWLQFDLSILAHCQSLYILKMEGWDQSKGVAREVAFAKEKGLQIVEIDPPKEGDYLPFLRLKEFV
jgi:hypothetical protein